MIIVALIWMSHKRIGWRAGFSAVLVVFHVVYTIDAHPPLIYCIRSHIRNEPAHLL